MRKGLAYTLFLTSLFCGCVDDSYMGAMGESSDTGNQSIPVVVSLGDSSGGLVKGSGAIDNSREWEDKHIYVYAFGKGEDVSFASTSRDEQYECLMDGTLASSGSPAGRKAVLEANDSYARWVDGKEVFYPYGKYRKMTYDFFAYYLDDAKVSASEYVRNDTTIVLHTEIDGSQDLMSGKAELTDEQLKLFTGEELELVKENAYGYYTAQRNIIPTFCLKHHLARLEFELVPGVVEEERKIITVHELELKSRYKAAFTVAHRDTTMLGLVFENGRKRMTLTEKGGEPIEEDAYVLTTRMSYKEKGEPVKMGGNLLVAPDETYDAYITMSEVREDGTELVSYVRTELQIAYESGVFEAGSHYNIRLTVYGATQVVMSVELANWRDGGDVAVDMDQEMENQY